MSGIKNTLVLLLAGGVGSRLNILVQTRAKPAVPFGGVYRIIDFALSNVMNSGLTRVGVLTQYKPLSLMRHLGSGETWDFTGRSRFVKILPPRTGSHDSDWYQGTADAIRRNIDFIKAHPSKEIVILSGDHIYSMDFAAMIRFHRQKKAEITVGMMRVEGEQIKQFGTGITDEHGRIVEWEEKPEHPRTDLASMGIYVFDSAYLLRLLAEDPEEIDFGMHLIPKAVGRDQVYAYPFTGYWRDVGTIQAYWQANMDILDSSSGITPETWGIRPNTEVEGLLADWGPARFLKGSRVENSLISAGCTIKGKVINSVLSPGVVVEPGAVVRDSVVLGGCHIGAGSQVDLAVLDKRVQVGSEVQIGYGERAGARANGRYPKHLYTGITLIGKMAEIPPGVSIGRNCIIQPFFEEAWFASLQIEAGDTL